MLRNVSITWKGLLVISVPIVMTLALLTRLYHIGSALEEALGWTMHSQRVLTVLEEASAGIVAIHGENLQRALLDTSETEFEINARSDAVRNSLGQLRLLVIGDPRQTAVADQFVPKVNTLLNELAKTQAELRAGHRMEGSTRAATDDRSLQSVLLLGEELRHDERKLAVDRLARAGEIGQERRITLIAGATGLVALVVLLGSSLMRSMLKRMLAIRQNVRLFAADHELTPPIPAQDEIGQIDLAVHEMARALRAQRRDNEMFIYSVSHDLRSPLVNLQGFSKELARSTDLVRQQLQSNAASPELRQALQKVLDEEVPESLHFIDLAVERQARIIDSLLSLSRAGRVEYKWTRVDLRACIESLVAERRRRSDLQQIEFSIGEVPHVEGDRDALERMFDNLLSNAVNYLSPDRPGRIEIGHRADANSDIVFVRDNGIGIANENLDRVFLPFSRFAGGKGEGIGLSLVRRVVDRHHGRVWVESELHVGTTVFVSFPRVRFTPPGTN